jgi:hypothetical protein
VAEDGLAALSGRPCRSPADALCLSDYRPWEAEENIAQLESYACRYLHQPLPVVQSWTWHELLARFEHVKDMVRAENGKPPRGEIDPDQKWQ